MTKANTCRKCKKVGQYDGEDYNIENMDVVIYMYCNPCELSWVMVFEDPEREEDVDQNSNG